MDSNGMYSNGMDSNGNHHNDMYNTTPGVQPDHQGNTEYRPDTEEAVSYGEWIISLIVLMIPCVNIIMMCVWAFSKSEKKSKSNYFKAVLTLGAAGFILTIVLVTLAGVSLAM